VGPRAGLDRWGKYRPPNGIRSPDLPARSELSRPTYLLYSETELFGTLSVAKIIRHRRYLSCMRVGYESGVTDSGENK
jgi:hypothetical protein